MSRCRCSLLEVCILLSIILSTTTSWAATEKNLHSFGSPHDGSEVTYQLVADAQGNFYGTTALGGSGGCPSGCGTAFELSRNGSGGWTEKKLHNFAGGNDGSAPTSGLTFDALGNLYGTTYAGGHYGQGVLFQLSPRGDGSWSERVLYHFGNGSDGAHPVGTLIFDGNGNLYGTTYAGGIYGRGTAYELIPAGNTKWTEKTLHNFGGGTDGGGPSGGMIFGPAGNLYGATVTGGAYARGTVYELAPSGGGHWREKKLHNFGLGYDGMYPGTELTFDAQRNLYGITGQGGSGTLCGSNGCGTVFELTPEFDGSWTERRIHNFGRSQTDGISPSGPLLIDELGNLYGTTIEGGSNYCGIVTCGTVFELIPGQGGSWSERKLHNFSMGPDGYYPYAGLVFDAAGNLYGASAEGGHYGGGAVYEITP